MLGGAIFFPCEVRFMNTCHIDCAHSDTRANPVVSMRRTCLMLWLAVTVVESVSVHVSVHVSLCSFLFFHSCALMVPRNVKSAFGKRIPSLPFPWDLPLMKTKVSKMWLQRACGFITSLNKVCLFDCWQDFRLHFRVECAMGKGGKNAILCIKNRT